MARTTDQIEHELKLNRELAASLDERAQELVRELDKAKITEPGAGHNRFSVLVKFAAHGKKYEFLLLRSPEGLWYTTGSSNHVKVFRTWAGLVAWLQGPDVHWHSDLQCLRLDNAAWSLSRGELVANDQGEAVF